MKAVGKRKEKRVKKKDGRHRDERKTQRDGTAVLSFITPLPL